MYITDANLFGDFMVPFGTAAIESAEWGAGFRDARLADAFTQRLDGSVIFRDDAVCSGVRDGVAVILVESAASAAPAAASADVDYEEQMRRALVMCAPWEKVGVSFASTRVLPFAHNRLPALRRPGWRRGFEWIEQAHLGRGVMRHAARYIALDEQ